MINAIIIILGILQGPNYLLQTSWYFLTLSPLPMLFQYFRDHNSIGRGQNSGAKFRNTDCSRGECFLLFYYYPLILLPRPLTFSSRTAPVLYPATTKYSAACSTTGTMSRGDDFQTKEETDGSHGGEDVPLSISKKSPLWSPDLGLPRPA